MKFSLICGNCRESSDSLTSSFWSDSALCKKCENLGLFMFFRNKKKPRVKQAIEPDCEHNYVDFGFHFCTVVPIYPQVCTKCGWYREVARPKEESA